MTDYCFWAKNGILGKIFILGKNYVLRLRHTSSYACILVALMHFYLVGCLNYYLPAVQFYGTVDFDVDEDEDVKPEESAPLQE